MFRLLKSMLRAGRGLRVALHEPNVRIELAAGVAVLALAIGLPVSPAQVGLLVLAVGTLLALEVVNTAVEQLVDLVEPKLHHYVAAVKDLLAAAVLLAAGVATLVSLLVVLPPLAARLGL